MIAADQVSRLRATGTFDRLGDLINGQWSIATIPNGTFDENQAWQRYILATSLNVSEGLKPRSPGEYQNIAHEFVLPLKKTGNL